MKKLFCEMDFATIPAYERSIILAAHQSPSFKKLIDLQDAYMSAQRRLLAGNSDHTDTLIAVSCTDAIRDYANNYAKELGLECTFGEGTPWLEIVDVFVDKSKEIRDLVDCFTE